MPRNWSAPPLETVVDVWIVQAQQERIKDFPVACVSFVMGPPGAGALGVTGAWVLLLFRWWALVEEL